MSDKAKIQKALGDAVKRLRSKSESVRENKVKLAALIVGKSVVGGLDLAKGLQAKAQMTMAATNCIIAVCEETTDNPHFQNQVVTLLSNTMDNAASRLNELANILESLGKSEKMQEAVVGGIKAFKDIEASAKASVTRSTRLRKLKVVPKPKRSRSKEEHIN